MKKLNIGVIYGGTNTEHEVSLVSARSVISNLNTEKYNVTPILIPKSAKKNDYANLLSQTNIDVYFPVLHGPYGEDGTIQGLLELMRIPYVGCGVLSSAICMDKDVQKRLCREAGIPVVSYQALTVNHAPKNIEFPMFVKPANQGSSIGVFNAKTPSELKAALNQAFKLDTKVLIEQAIVSPREIECAVLGDTNKPEVSVLGEIIPSNDFYDYDAKYVDDKSKSMIPADLTPSLTDAIKAAAQKAFTVCECFGLARVDFLVPKQGRRGEYYLSELNTLPGFTSISMYPKLWQATGLSYPKLLDKLINLALTRHRHRSQLNSSFKPKSSWYL